MTGLTQHNVEEGTLVRPGQQLGVFTDNKNLEVEVAVNAAYMGQIKVGDPVAIQIKNSTNTISANVQRINATIESSTQTGKLFIDLKNSQLKSGMDVNVKVEAFSDKKLIKIPLSLLLDSKYVYGVKNERLVALSVVPEHYFVQKFLLVGLRMIHFY